MKPEQPNWIYSNLGYLLSQQGELEEAIGFYQKAIQAKTEPVNAYFLERAELFFQKGDFQQALCAYQQTVLLSDEWKNETDERLIDRPLPNTVPRICIVTPVFNSESYIDETIYSIVTQVGHFSIRYHVQDAQSTDGTLDKLKEWERRLREKQIPLLCEGIEFTFASAGDRGMYDAINQAVAQIDLEDSDYMTWINADDRLAPGALATIADIFDTFDRIHWLGGRISLINERGITTHLSAPIPFNRQAIQAGLHDGRKLPFIMQEGTFWRGWLWNEVKGVKASFRFAGDYDLWKRFAEHSSYVLVDTVLATHRRRPGQLSGTMNRYYQEVDAVLSRNGIDRYEETWETFNLNTGDELEQVRQDFSGRILQYDSNLHSWHYSQFPYTLHLSPSIFVSTTVNRSAIAATFGKGFGMMENSNPIKNLPNGVRWTLGRTNHLEFEVEESGEYEITLICQTFDRISVSLNQNEKNIFGKDLPLTNHTCNCKIVAVAEFVKGKNLVELGVTYTQSLKAGRMIVISCEAVFQPSIVGIL